MNTLLLYYRIYKNFKKDGVSWFLIKKHDNYRIVYECRFIYNKKTDKCYELVGDNYIEMEKPARQRDSKVGRIDYLLKLI